MVESEALSFPVLVDEDLEVVKAYGILNEDNPKVPHPAVVVIDQAGIVRFVHLDEDYRRRPAPEVILAALEKVAAGETAPLETAPLETAPEEGAPSEEGSR